MNWHVGFQVKRGLSVSLVKSNPDNPLIVNSIDISASMVNNTKKNVTKNAVTEEVSFACAGNPTAPAFNFAKKGGKFRLLSRQSFLYKGPFINYVCTKGEGG